MQQIHLVILPACCGVLNCVVILYLRSHFTSFRNKKVYEYWITECASTFDLPSIDMVSQGVLSTEK